MDANCNPPRHANACSCLADSIAARSDPSETLVFSYSDTPGPYTYSATEGVLE